VARSGGTCYLKWCTGEEETVVALEGANNLGQGRVLVLQMSISKVSEDICEKGFALGFNLDTVSLVNHNVLPGVLLERTLLFNHHLIGGDTDVKVSWDETIRTKCKALVFVSMELEDIETWQKHKPVRNLTG